jgi:CHAT domain-containing protein
MTPVRLRRALAFACCVLLAGAAAASDLAISSLAQQGKHHELIREVQGRVDRKEDVSSFQLLMLGGSYYEARQYRGLLATAEVMAKRIAAGDASYFGADLSVYPQIFRALVALDLGAYEDAIRLASAAKLNPDQIFHRVQVIQTGSVLGVANAFLGRAEEARKQLERVRAVSISMSNLGPEKFVAMARIHMALKEYDQALQAISDPDANVSAFLTAFYDPTFQNLPKFFIRAKSQFETGRRAEAKAGYDQLLKHPQIAEYGSLYWVSLYDRARIALAEGDAGTAIELLRKALEAIERQRSSIDSEAGRIGFVGDKQSVYQLLVSLLLARGEAAPAFEYVERSKARALVDLLASQRGVPLKAQSADAERTLRKLSEAEAEDAAMAPPGEGGRGVGTRAVLDDLRKQLRTQAPELASLVTVTGIPHQTIQALLEPGEALLEYYYSDTELHLFVLTREAIRAVKLERGGLEDAVAGFRKCLGVPTVAGCTEGAQALYARLFAPAAAQLQATRLVIVPHGVLHYLPFAALHTGQSYLLEQFPLRVQPSAAVLDLIKDRQQKRASASALLLGNPNLGRPELDLKHAGEEAVAVAKLFAGAKVLLREDARASVVKSEGERYAVLHFATHGTFNLEAPMSSALLLAPEPGSNGRLTVADLYGLKLDADLVTLSACETALGKLANGDDVVGFTRGLLYAGSSSIVSSLWSVDDLATRDLMVSFYANLPKLGKLEALRQAQLAVLRQRPHPFFWAAFVLTGNAK